MAINQSTTYPTKTNAPNTDYPYGSARNVTVPSDGTGYPWESSQINDWIGFFQHMLSYASVVPSNNPDKVGTSQHHDALRKTCGYPGLIQLVGLNVDPASLGIRLLLLNGAVISIANYQDLVTATYVGNTENATADGFYKTSDPAGTIRSVSGTYFVLPDARGRFVRMVDDTSLIDIDGGPTRIVGSNQDWAIKKHEHQVKTLNAGTPALDDYFFPYQVTITGSASSGEYVAYTPNDGTSDPIYGKDMYALDSAALNVSNNESRPVNIGLKYAVWY